MADWVEQRDHGRRESDTHQCVMHDYMFAKNENCLNIIKQTIKDEVLSRDKKIQAINDRVNHLVSYTAAGLISSIAIGLLGIIMAIILTTLSSMQETDEQISEKLNGIVIGQEMIVRRFDQFAPEHELLMNHLRESMTNPNHTH